MCKAQEAKGILDKASKPVPSPIFVGDLNDVGTEVYISQEPSFNFVLIEEEEVPQGILEDFDMFFENEDSSWS